MYKWLWFDLDNTLLDFNKSAQDAFRLLMEELGIENSKENKKIYDEINHECWIKFELGELSLETIKKGRFQKFFDAIGYTYDGLEANDKYLNYIGANPYFVDSAHELLAHCSTKQYKMAIITNGMTLAQFPRLKKLQIDHFFEHIFVSEEIGFSKPSLAYFNHCKEVTKLGHKDDVLIIGDNLASDILGGNHFGADVCWLNAKGQNADDSYHIKYEISQLDELMKIV